LHGTHARGTIAGVSVAPTNQVTTDKTLTLGELLYADPTITLVSEKQWLALIRAIAVGDEAALRLLYEKAVPVVFTYLIRLTGDRHLTDTVILEVFQTVWWERLWSDCRGDVEQFRSNCRWHPLVCSGPSTGT
jgi:hypothetical protein